ncbi:MAG: glycosyltransferase [Candidatus Levybacteria bacterium]|nr:glycosyltransferase [Candidatus Levybacteria bacterium]
MKVALVYDRVNKWGGAERVLISLKKIFPKAVLYTSVYDEKKAPWAKAFKVKTSFLQKFPFAKSSHELFATLMPLSFESFNFDDYNLVISVTSEFSKAVITKPQTLHICYCLTPTRYLWSGYEIYFKNRLLRFISTPLVSYLRNFDKVAALRPDFTIAISNEVKKRIKKYYNLDSTVINAPIDFPNIPLTKQKGKYFLIVSRFVAYKKIDLAISAFNETGQPLKIIGSGGEEKRLKQMAGKNIEFIKDVSDQELFEYYKNSIALVFPGLEDFGLTMIEANYFGRPVIAFRGGGALDIVKEGVTGEFFNEQSKESLIKVLEKFKVSLYNEKSCRENALRFSLQYFRTNLEAFINTHKNL